MTLRTFKQFAQGFGTEPCEVTVQLDGNTIFSGSVATVDQPLPMLPNGSIDSTNLGWHWQHDVTFYGTKTLSVAVTGSSLILAETLANNPYSYANAEVFYGQYSTVVDDVTYYDPFTDESIDGVPQAGPYRPDIPGQWWWHVPPGSTFTATLHVTAPPVPPTPPEPPPEEAPT